MVGGSLALPIICNFEVNRAAAPKVAISCRIQRESMHLASEDPQIHPSIHPGALELLAWLPFGMSYFSCHHFFFLISHMSVSFTFIIYHFTAFHFISFHHLNYTLHCISFHFISFDLISSSNCTLHSLTAYFSCVYFSSLISHMSVSFHFIIFHLISINFISSLSSPLNTKYLLFPNF